MLLMKLKPKEKFAFLQLAHYLARIDSDYGEKEEEIILEYCSEMGIENDEYFDIKLFSLEDILKNFKSKKSRKIVVLELMVLIYADDKFHLKEQILISEINSIFKLSLDNLEFCSQWGKGIASLYSQGKLFIENEIS